MSQFAAGRVALCLAGLFTAAFSSVLYAEEPDPEVLEVRDVVVSSTRLPGEAVDARALPAKVTVITADDIRRSGAKTVQEAIQWATGIVMYDQVGNNFQQTIDLRGFNGQPVPQTSVFVDGMRMNEPDFNTVNFDLIPYQTIDRIEILPGPSAIYGKNAMGGVINIITKRGTDRHQATGETMFGSFHRERYTVNASGPLGKLDYYTNFSRETENGYRNESDARISRFSGKIGYRPTDATDLTLSYTYVQDRLLQAGSLPLTLAQNDPKLNFTPGDFTQNETSVVRLNGRQMLPFGFSLNTNIFYRRLNQELFGVGQPFLVGGILSRATTFTDTESRGGTIQLNHDADFLGHHNQFVVGGELTRNDLNSRLSSFSDFGPFRNRRDTDEMVTGIYAQNTFNLTSQLILTTGVRYDRNRLTTDFEDDFTSPDKGTKVFHRVNPRAGLSYLITRNITTYLNYSQGFRTPTVDELFTIVGASNPNLKPAHSDNYELGMKTQLGGWGEAVVAVFQTDVRNEIFFNCTVCDPFSPAFNGLNRNVDQSRRRGVEMTFKGRYNEHFDGVINYTFTEAEFQSRFNASATSTIEVGDSFPLVPKHRLAFIGNYHPAVGWTLSLIGLYVSTQFYLNDESNTRPRIPGYFLLNGRVAYERKVPGGRLNAFLMMNNLANQHYFTSGILASNTLTGGGAVERFVIPAPTLAFYGGLSYRFESFLN